MIQTKDTMTQLMRHGVGDGRGGRSFLSHKDKSILLVETNVTHGEVIAGYVKYFIDLGYQVDILINSDILKETFFELISEKPITYYENMGGEFTSGYNSYYNRSAFG